MEQNSQGQCSRVPSGNGHTYVDIDPSISKCYKEQISLAVAFDKQSMLELHLKWNQAFMVCGIPFNVKGSIIYLLSKMYHNIMAVKIIMQKIMLMHKWRVCSKTIDNM